MRQMCSNSYNLREDFREEPLIGHCWTFNKSAIISEYDTSWRHVSRLIVSYNTVYVTLVPTDALTDALSRYSLYDKTS